MNVKITPHGFSGEVRIPASKSHTIRQLLIASLADGVSEILHPLDSLDTRSCVSACRVFGAEIEEQSIEGGIKWVVKGKGKREKGEGRREIDVGNSGTTLYLALAIAGLQDTPITFTGDESIQKRSAAPLLDALANLGIYIESNNGCAPITVKGPWKGGKVTLSCPTSQYLSAILIAAPLAPAGTVTEIEVPLLNELPYIEMTLSYLKVNSINFKTNFSLDSDSAPRSPLPTPYYFTVPGGQNYRAFSSSVPADFSSAAFPAAAAAITGGKVTLLGLDPEDTQGDKYFLEILKEMGCEVEWQGTENRDKGTGNSEQRAGSSEQKEELVCVISRNKPLKGGVFDLNNTPDLLPAAAAVAAFADGDTAFINVAHARIKETDRIAVMGTELAKLGVKTTENPDGLIIHGRSGIFVENSKLSSSAPCSLLPAPCLNGHGDHRIVMALAVAALGAPFPVEITDAEAADVTYPGFLKLIS